MSKIIVEATPTACGIEVIPLNHRWAQRFAKHVRGFTGHYDESVLFQDGGPLQEFLEMDVPPRHRRALERGHRVAFKVDPWTVGHWYGWDAHTVAE